VKVLHSDCAELFVATANDKLESSQASPIQGQASIGVTVSRNGIGAPDNIGKQADIAM
jgi:hypothetical protein